MDPTLVDLTLLIKASKQEEGLRGMTGPDYDGLVGYCQDLKEVAASTHFEQKGHMI